MRANVKYKLIKDYELSNIGLKPRMFTLHALTVISDISFLYHAKIPGSVAERSKALVLGTSLFGGVGSNPTAAISFF